VFLGWGHAVQYAMDISLPPAKEEKKCAIHPPGTGTDALETLWDP